MDISVEYARLQERLRQCQEDASAGKKGSDFFAELCDSVLRSSEQAWASKDALEIVKAFRDMQDVLSGNIL